jgi:hypothetical protein
MIGMALAKSLYAIPTWTRTVALVAEHSTLAATIAPDADVPSVYACCRFTAKLREHRHLLDACVDAVLTRLRDGNPGMGENVAIDASDMAAYANGQRFTSKRGRNDPMTSSPTLTPPGDTAPPSRRARAAASTATDCTWPWTRPPTFRSHGG